MLALMMTVSSVSHHLPSDKAEEGRYDKTEGFFIWFYIYLHLNNTKTDEVKKNVMLFKH